jgi:hypothetical protein
VGISWDYPLQTRTSKQPIRVILGYRIIPSNPLKYPGSKQGLEGGVANQQTPRQAAWLSNLTRGTTTLGLASNKH